MFPSELTPFEKGLDFATHFMNKQFTIHDIRNRYEVTYRQATNLKQKAERLFTLDHIGFCEGQRSGTGSSPYLWRMTKR